MAWCVSLTLTEYLVLFRKENLDGLVREFDVLTLSTTMWHVLEYDHYKLHEQSYGQFHDGDTYVVRWQYMITASGTHTQSMFCTSPPPMKDRSDDPSHYNYLLLST